LVVYSAVKGCFFANCLQAGYIASVATFSTRSIAVDVINTKETLVQH
jgi:hypothetical protein